MATPPAGPVADFCAELRRLVRACGVAQAEIAQALGRGASSVSELLGGRRRTAPDWDEVRLIVGLCAQRHTVRSRSVGPRPDVEWWRGRHAELERAVERTRTTPAAGPLAPLSVTPPPPAPAASPVLDAADCLDMGVDKAVSLLADGRTELMDTADGLLEPLHGDSRPPYVLDALLEGFPQRVRAVHGLARGALLRAARVALAEALTQCAEHLSQLGAEDFVRLLTREALQPPEPDRTDTDDTSDSNDSEQRARYVHCVQSVTRLTLSCPEFALNSAPRGTVVRATADGPDATGLAGLEALLAECAGQDMHLRAESPRLRDPIASLDSPGPRLPSLAQGYVNPRFRLATPQGPEGFERGIASDKWWAQQPAYDTVEHFFAAYLLGLPALLSPLLVLGHPGAGKSLLTRLLAARLPTGEFRPLPVELRYTPAEADVQTQLEHALKRATGRSASWPDWSEAEPGVIPVVLLDGFDELLQAGAQRLDAARQWGYLQEVERFQRREAELGRPLIVIVTSRTVVADRAVIPQTSQVLRLEPFGQPQIARWLSIWNTANTDYLTRLGLRPLAMADVFAHHELAAQPLLLLMLALYDAVGNGLQRLREEDISRTQLYDRLLTEFVRRQVEKDGPLPPAETDAAVERELHRLSVIALGMFHRGAQSISGQKAGLDLATLDTSAPDDSGLLFGRFFFVHEAQAVVTEQRLRSYEFMHATFGEHLAARLVDQALRRLVDAESPVNDGELYALLSFTPLTDRAQLMQNLRDRLEAWPTDRPPTVLVQALIGLFRATKWDPEDRTHTKYRPLRVPRRYREAVYEANLLLVMVLAAGEVHASDLIGAEDETVTGWRRHALGWQAQLSGSSWDLFCSTLSLERRMRRLDDGGPLFPDLLISTRRTPLVHHELRWPTTDTAPDPLPERMQLRLDSTGITRLIRRSTFAGDFDTDLLLHLGYPMLLQLPDAARILSGPRSPVHALLALLTRNVYDPWELPGLYRTCLGAMRSLDGDEVSPYLDSVLRQLVHDAPTLPAEALASVLTELCRALSDERATSQDTERLLLRIVREALDRGGPDLIHALAPLRKFFIRRGSAVGYLEELTHISHSTLTWKWSGSLRGQTGAHHLDRVLENLDLATTASTHPAAIVTLLRLATELDLDDWLKANAPKLLAALPARAFGLLRPSDLGPLRAALPEGAYVEEFEQIEWTWRDPEQTPW
ncbi:hypothetical protein ACWDBW_27805 [Streptomyces sp. NPDC001107]